MARTKRQIWYGGLTGNNATILEGDTLYIGHLPMNQMAPAYDALSKGAAIRDWLGGRALVLPVRDIQAIQADNVTSQLKLGYFKEGEANEVEISLSNPPPTVATLRGLIPGEDWEEESEPGLVGDALNGPIGCGVLLALFAGLGAFLASQPRPPVKNEWLDDTMNGLVHGLGPLFFYALIGVIVVVSILWGIRAVRNRPPAKIRLVRARTARKRQRADEDD
jgi:hypothetical protein